MYGIYRLCFCVGFGVVTAWLMAGGHSAYAQPPETILIRGQLLDSEGAPIVGLRQYRVRFYDAETDGAQLGGDVTDVTQVNFQGLFAIALIPPAAVLDAPAAWYELALDSGTPALGVGPEDVFPQRVRVHSVPFARVAGEALRVEVEAIGDGSVTQSEFNTLTGIVGNVQVQLDAKADTAAIDEALDEKPDFSEVLPRSGAGFVVVETTDDPVQNGANLQAAYAEAAASLPHGENLGEDNRAVVVVPPGKYDLGAGQLVMDTPYVDLVGSTTARDNHHIFGTAAGPNSGVLRQLANHVRIENLFVECTADSGAATFSASDPAAYYPEGGLLNTVVRNCRFLANDFNAWSMRIGVEFAGTYENTTGGAYAFGGAGNASGSFTNCTGGNFSFGGVGGTAIGDFTNCTGGSASFGGGAGGTASGDFINCTGGNFAFGGGVGAVSSGRFKNCTGATGAFGGDGAAIGIYHYCVGGNESFGAFGSATDGVFYHCIGGPSSFTETGSPTVLYSVRNNLPYP